MRQLRQPKPRLRGNSGQAAVLAALCMFTMIVFVALATNMGVLTSDRIRMQNVADVSAYAGALEQARVLNKVRLHEKSVVRRAAGLRWALTLEPAPIHFFLKTNDCRTSPIPEKILKVYKKVLDVKKAEVALLLRRGQNSATRAAQLTAQKNMTGMGFGRSFENYRIYQESPTYLLKSLLEPPSQGEVISDSISPELAPAQLDFSYAVYGGCQCKKKCCIFPFRSNCWFVQNDKHRGIDAWWYKISQDATVFYPLRLVGTPLKRFFDVHRYRGLFGAGPRTRGKRNNQISVFSAAKPYDGGISPNPNYFPEINDTRSVKMLFGVRKNLHTWDELRDVYQEFYEDRDTRYRARIVGLHEQVGKVSGGGPTIAGFDQLLTNGPDPHQLTGAEYGMMLH